MTPLLHTEFAALLARADVAQATFARLTGVTPRQVNNWCRGRAAVPQWAALLALVLADFSPETLAIMAAETAFSWHETLGVPPVADAGAARRAMTKLALIYHPDTGGSQAQMSRINAAYEARTSPEDDARSTDRH
jgi:transcriptional regulator with XRE-family HTH domain